MGRSSLLRRRGGARMTYSFPLRLAEARNCQLGSAGALDLATRRHWGDRIGTSTRLRNHMDARKSHSKPVAGRRSAPPGVRIGRSSLLGHRRPLRKLLAALAHSREVRSFLALEMGAPRMLPQVRLSAAPHLLSDPLCSMHIMHRPSLIFSLPWASMDTYE